MRAFPRGKILYSFLNSIDTLFLIRSKDSDIDENPRYHPAHDLSVSRITKPIFLYGGIWVQASLKFRILLNWNVYYVSRSQRNGVNDNSAESGLRFGRGCLKET